MSRSRRAMRGAGQLRLVAHLGVWLYVLLLLVPLYYLAISSLKTNTAILDSPFDPFRGLQFDNFARAWQAGDLGRGLVNQAYITIAANVLTLVLAVPAAFALARTRGRLGRLVERIFTVGFLVPGFAALVPTVLLAIRLELFHTREFLILLLPASALPLSVVLLTQAMRTVPDELEESAIIDGASPLRVLISVYAPLTLPTLTVVLILNFLSFWNEYFFALVIAGPDPAVRTAQVALPLLSMANAAQYGVLAAGIVITLVPVYVVYLFFADKMEGAVLSGALKG